LSADLYRQLKTVWGEFTGPGGPFEVVTQEVLGAPTRCYKDAPGSVREVWLSTQQFAERDYLIYNDERLTYAQTHERVASIANWLAAQGVQPGDRVAIAMRNYPEWMQAYWAIVSMGAVCVGMNAWWVGEEVHYALSDSQPKVVISDSERLERLEPMLGDFPDLKVVAVRVDKKLPAGVVPFSELVEPS